MYMAFSHEVLAVVCSRLFDKLPYIEYLVEIRKHSQAQKQYETTKTSYENTNDDETVEVSLRRDFTFLPDVGRF